MDLSAVDRGSLVSNLFITISGPPGCGGTTLTEALAARSTAATSPAATSSASSPTSAAWGCRS
jgi:hypothetical protein